MRTSSYTIYVEPAKTEDKTLLVHGYNGAYDLVSREVSRFLRKLEFPKNEKPLFGEWTPDAAVEAEAPAPSQKTIEILKRRCYLTHMTPEQEEDLFAHIATKIHEQRLKYSPPGYVIIPTYDCNLRCSYCYQNQMRTSGRGGGRLEVMNRNMVDRIFEVLAAMEAKEGSPDRNRQVTLFGGEPLLASTRGVNEYIIEKASLIGEISFRAITNGTELNHYRDLLGPGAISSLQITLDGPPAAHDERRVFPNGDGSFEQIANNISMALDLGVHVALRVNVDAGNLDALPDLAEEIVARQWHKNKAFVAYTSPIRFQEPGPNGEGTLGLWQLDQNLARLRTINPLMRVISGPGDGITRQAERLFAGELPYMTMKSSFCGAHTKMYVFDPLGDIYACWERTGDPRSRIGRVTANGGLLMNPETVKRWRSRTVAASPICRKCRYALFCGGGCAVLAMANFNTFATNFCDGFASRFRTAIAKAFVAYRKGISTGSQRFETCEM